MTITIRTGDCRNILRELPDESVHCVVTSPPYWGLRDYGVAGQLGMEASLGEYVAVMVEVFREVRRVLRKDGTLWLNLGDSYAAQINGRSAHDTKLKGTDNRTFRDKPFSTVGNGLKPKDLCGIPWRVAFALQADGWWLRQDIIWAKPNPMPESVTDRCTKAHEYLFLLSKSKRYYYDAEAIKTKSDRAGEVAGTGPKSLSRGSANGANVMPSGNAVAGGFCISPEMSNKRSVWEVTTQPFSEAHFATFPPALIEPCIKAGTSEKGCCAKCGNLWVRQVDRAACQPQRTGEWKATGENHRNDIARKGGFNDARAETLGWSPSCSCNAATVPCTVLDPFAGAGTTGLVADRLQRNAILIELNPTYADMSQRRITDDAPLFAQVNDYDATDDFSRSIDEAYRVIRERKTNGGKGWGGWE